MSLRVLMATAELAPLAKVGGLADMTAGLAGALAAAGHDVRVVLPLYPHLDREALRLRPLAKLPPFQVQAGQRLHVARWWQRATGPRRPRVYLWRCDALLGPDGIYGEAADGAPPDLLPRWVGQGRAALALPTALDWRPDVVHCHDAASALAAVYLRRWCGTTPGLAAAGSLLTVHNLAHQEVHPAWRIGELGLPPDDAVYPGLLEFYGQLDLLKAGILAADLVNTVSPTYAREALTDPRAAHGLDGVLRLRGDDFTGILNGIDPEVWDPATDPLLPARYGPGRLDGKRTCARRLAAELKLEADGPLLGLVGRLVEQKGLDALLAAVPELVAAGARLAVLGTGQPEYRRGLEAAAAAHPGRVAFARGMEEGLAHRIVAGSDLFLLPSRFEPCGLTQLYALRYGTVPVARRTGGLADTIVDAAEPDGDGFLYEGDDAAALAAAVGRALAARAEPERWAALVARGMGRDFTWSRSAGRYEDLYARIATRRRQP